jgi:VIT1/CCC1 family predicted Fe2+/Mn2+ transporter
MAEARKAFKLATLEREELELMNDISNHENQLLTALNDDQRKELKLALKIARLELEINGYKIDLENATTEEEKRRLSDTLNKARDTLNAQLEHKQSSGKSI